MGYLICQECGGYYKLEKDESIEDFVSCECYGSLTYVNDINDHLNGNNKVDKDLNGNTENVNAKYASNVKSDNFVDDSESPSSAEGELPQKKEISEPFSFPTTNESKKSSPSVKNRTYYREISSKDIKPDIKKLKFIKDVNGIIEALNYDGLEIKLEAVKALGAMGDVRALKHLDKLRKEETGVLKTYAENAIFHIESKNNGLKSQNRAYYQEEYYKGISRKSDENKSNKSLGRSDRSINQFKPIDQTIVEIKEKTADKTSKMPNNSPYQEMGNAVKTGDTDEKGIKSDDIGVKSQDLIETNKLSKINVDSVTKGIPEIRKSIPESKNISETNISETNISETNISETNISETNIISTEKNAKLPVKSDSEEVNSREVSKLVSPSEIIKTDISKKPTPKIDEIKRINETEGINSDDIYFIQFLGIKKTDKPLIGFILMFIASLGIGVLLTMGYT